jgi:hypothetical protein
MIDLLEDAEALLDQLPEAVTRRKLGERLSQAVDALRNVDRQIARIKALLELSRIVEFGQTADQRATLHEMKDCATEIGSSLEEADDAEQLRLAVFEYQNSLNLALGALERALRERWRTVATDRFLPLIGSGELLASMNVSNNLGSRLAECGRKGLASPNTGSIIDLLPVVRSLLADFDALQFERAAEVGDDQVGDFVNALAENRATLAMVTPKVHEWLNDHHALERLQITAR